MTAIDISGTVPRSIYKLTSHGEKIQNDLLAVEEPLQIRLEINSVNGRLVKNVAVTMRTPGNDQELAAGFFFTEGIIDHPDTIESISRAAVHDNEVLVRLKEGVFPNLINNNRQSYSNSSCGVCGKTNLDAIRINNIYKAKQPFCINRSIIFNLPDTLLKHQQLFENTGGIHAVALFDLQGNLITLKEDIGRHNALDKVIGSALFKQLLPLNDHIVLFSGRAGFEMIQKAAMAGINIVASIGAPSSLAVELAEEFGITLIGFLRENSMNIYTGKERIS